MTARRAALGTGVPAPPTSPLLALAAAVLETALDDARGRTGRGLALRERERARADAEAWLAGAPAPLRFDVVAAGLGLDADCMRKALGLG